MLQSAYKELYKGSFEEIKELDDEYLYTSGLQSNENTERRSSQQRVEVFSSDNKDTKVNNTIDLNRFDHIGSMFQQSQFNLNTHRTVQTNEVEIDKLANQSLENFGKEASEIEVLSYPEENFRSGSKERENLGRGWKKENKVNSAPRNWFENELENAEESVQESKLLVASSPTCLKNEPRKLRPRNFRSIDKFESLKGQKSSEEIIVHFKNDPTKFTSPVSYKRRTRPSLKKNKPSYSFFTSVSESSKAPPPSPMYSTTNYQTHSSSRTGASKSNKNVLFQDIVRKTSQSFLNPFLKSRRPGDVLGKNEKTEERTRN